MNRLVFIGNALQTLRDQLLSSALERAAMLLAHPVQISPESWRLLVSDIIVVPDNSYSRQSEDGLEIPAVILVPLIKRARNNRSSIVLAHTHPWDGFVLPSPVDRRGEAILLPTLFQRVPDVPHGRLIFGHKDTHAALLESTSKESSAEVRGIGPDIVYAPKLRGAGNDYNNADPVFNRQVRAFGAVGQARLAEMKVAIVGLGGTGSVVTQQLAYLGVQNFLLIDPDTLELTNLNRVVGANRHDVGQAKVHIAERMIKQINPSAHVTLLQEDVVLQTTARSILGTDFFFACTDSQGSRAVLTQISYQYLLPGVDVGVRIDVRDGRVANIVGRVQMLAPGLACTSCTRLLDPEAVRRDLLTTRQREADPYIVGGREDQPSVISLNTTVSGMAVSMFMAAVTGAPMHARHQIVLFDSGIVKAIANTPDPECSVCSSEGFLGRGDSWPLPGRRLR